MTDNQAFYVTPPTIFMPTKGMRFSLISTDEDWVKETSDSLEKAFHSQLTFYHLEGAETAETICWQMLYSDYSDFILIDANNLTMAQSMISAANMHDATTWWHTPDETDSAMTTLLTALGAHTYDELEDFIEAIKGMNNV